MSKAPMVAFGNRELDAAPAIGHMCECPRCGHTHQVEESKPPLLHYVRCDDGECYIVGLKGKDVTGMLRG